MGDVRLTDAEREALDDAWTREDAEALEAAIEAIVAARLASIAALLTDDIAEATIYGNLAVPRRAIRQALTAAQAGDEASGGGLGE